MVFGRYTSGLYLRALDLTGKGGTPMHDKEELCKKITEIYPDLGECGINITVDFDKQKNVWVVDLKKDKHVV